MKKLIPLLLVFLFSRCYPITFDDIKDRKHIYLYAGDLVPIVKNRSSSYNKFTALSLNTSNANHIKWDVTNPFPLPDNCVDIFQSEDVFEHIELSELPAVINEIYRVLKPGGFFRFSVPDYRFDYLVKRVQRNALGEMIFDPGGGGRYDKEAEKVVAGGHVWFPTIELVEDLFNGSHFAEYGKINYLHYYTQDGEPVLNRIDYSKAYVYRTPDHDNRATRPYRPFSIVVDLYK